MKSCDEMVSSLFQRKEKYELKRKRRILSYTVATVSCACILSVIGFGNLNGDAYSPRQPISAAESSIITEPDATTVPLPQNRIILNQISSISADRQNICLWLDDFVRMDKTELNEYYGINVFPCVPEDIPEWDDQLYGIYKRDGGTGEVYWDCIVLNYDNEDFSRGVHLEIQKGSLPVLDYFFLNGREEKSVINNVEVMIGLSENGYYYAEFMYQNVGFCVNATGVTQDEFVEIIASLIQ